MHWDKKDNSFDAEYFVGAVSYCFKFIRKPVRMVQITKNGL